jgi:P pilus assembly chaperone PapD
MNFFKRKKEVKELLFWINSEGTPTYQDLYDMRKKVVSLAIKYKIKNYYYNKELEQALIYATLRRLNYLKED